MLFFLSLIRSQVFLELFLDLQYNIVHFLLLIRLNGRDVLRHIVQLLNDLLALLAASVKLAGKQLVLARLVLLHHVFNILHLVLQLVNKAIDFITASSLLLENVPHGSTLVVGAIDLLLEHSVLLALQIPHSVIGVVFESLLELRILNLTPSIKIKLLLLGIILTLLLSLVLSTELVSADVVQTVHITIRISVAFFSFHDAFIGAKHSLQLCDLIVEGILFSFIVT